MNPSPPASQARRASDLTPSPGLVAIVDDDPHIAQVLSQWLEFQGLRAACYPSGESLLQAVHEERGQCVLPPGVGDVATSRLTGAVLDLNLPGISGFELAAALRQIDPGLPLVIITALQTEERTRHGAPPPGVPCLKKPFDLDELEDALLPLLRNSMP